MKWRMTFKAKLVLLIGAAVFGLILVCGISI